MYLSLPYKYHEWFHNKWPLDPITKNTSISLAIPCLRGMQGTKSAGHDWYKLISGTLQGLGMIRSSSDHAIYIWNYKGDGTLHP